jgi:D-alanyl-D-alanine carboxypeptidase/D-alanyl-D-alanine-endopeptidase (penicillin-binding protein 4)
MRLNKKIKYWFYKSLSVILAVAIVANSWSLEPAASALPPQQAIASASGNICPHDLYSVLDPIVNSPTFANGQWGVLVQSLATGNVLYQHNPSSYLIPASNVKLLTTAAALQNVPKLPPTDVGEWLQSIGLANRDSNNYQADSLLNRVGGVEAIRSAISPLGVNPNTYVQVDGSGLSRSNRAEPETFVSLLKAISATPESQIFYDSLSIGGVNGTLRNRLRDPLVRGRVHAKTGTLTGVRSLSGYLENPNYGAMVFSIMVNQWGQSGKVMTNAIDEMVLDLAQVKNCG